MVMPRRPKINYREGDWFMLPLPGLPLWAAGVVARMDGQGRCLGYFFLFNHVPTLQDVASLRAANAVLCTRFGDPNLVEGKWPILGQVPGWRRDAWPVPTFGREVTGGLCFLSVYDDRLEFVSESRTTPDEVRRFPRDGLSGADAVPMRLVKIAREQASTLAPAA